MKAEADIEYEVEKSIDRLDKQYMRGVINQEQYESFAKFINEWADSMYEKNESSISPTEVTGSSPKSILL